MRREAEMNWAIPTIVGRCGLANTDASWDDGLCKEYCLTFIGKGVGLGVQFWLPFMRNMYYSKKSY